MVALSVPNVSCNRYLLLVYMFQLFWVVFKKYVDPLNFWTTWSIPWIFFTNIPIPEDKTLTKMRHFQNF